MTKGQITGLGCLAVIIIVLVIVGGWALSAYNGMVKERQNVEAAWGQVENVYQRRADLLPNLVRTVQGYAAHEKEVLEAVTASRSQVGSIRLTPELLKNPAELQKFEQQQAGLQNALQSTLSRLLVVAERYPDLKANQNFLDLQAQIEGSENRINTERNRYNKAVQAYNTKVLSFPARIIASMSGFEKKDYFQSAAGSKEAPVVDFSK